MHHWPCLLLLAVAACTPDYPMDRAGSWHLGETSTNDDNLRTMLVNPRDLVAGASERDTLAAEAAPPVQRLLSGRRKPLPASSVVQFQVTGTAEPQAQGGNNAGQ